MADRVRSKICPLDKAKPIEDYQSIHVLLSRYWVWVTTANAIFFEDLA